MVSLQCLADYQILFGQSLTRAAFAFTLVGRVLDLPAPSGATLVATIVGDVRADDVGYIDTGNDSTSLS